MGGFFATASGLMEAARVFELPKNVADLVLNAISVRTYLYRLPLRSTT